MKTTFFTIALLLTITPFLVYAQNQNCGNNASLNNGSQNDPPGTEPVNPYTENEYYEAEDLTLYSGVGQHLTFGRWANSRFVPGAQYFGNGHYS